MTNLRKLILLLILLLPSLQISELSAQTETTALAFSVDDRPAVAVLRDGEWVVELLPEPSVFAQWDVMLTDPFWSNDAQILYVLAEDGNPDTYIVASLMAYDIQTGELSLAVNVEPEDGSFRVLDIVWHSDDGRFVMMVDATHSENYLIDLTTGSLILSNEGDDTRCAYSVIASDDEQIALLKSRNFLEDCLPAVVWVDASNGEIIAEVSLPDDQYLPEFYLQDTGTLLSDGRVVITESGSVGVIDPVSNESVFFQSAFAASISPDESTLVYADPFVYQVNLETMAVVRMDYYAERTFYSGEMLVTYYRNVDDDITEWVRAEIHDDEAIPTLSVTLTPDDVLHQITVNSILYQSGTVLGRISLQGDESCDFAEGICASILPDLASLDYEFQSILVEAAINSGELALAESPDDFTQEYRVMSHDGVWWFFARLPVQSDYENPQDSLIAHNIVTGETVTLVESVNLGEHNFHFRPWRYYIVAP